jgi:hypothetical protein
VSLDGGDVNDTVDIVDVVDVVEVVEVGESGAASDDGGGEEKGFLLSMEIFDVENEVEDAGPLT